MLDVQLESNRYMAQFFRQFKLYARAVKLNIANELPEIIRHRPHKIKAAYHLKRAERVIYEYKIVLSPEMNFRAAYIQDKHHITVFFISDTLIKHEFVKQLAATDLVDAANGLAG
ncbi:hypothetical protein [Deefgea piscis]|uniref:hypothetical protein n=1 Tax=Deefgea piscis TaxID=2739061 RepID=UPI001C816B11|nr:hypothetical protein [Deefgea piscis]QZA81370.1 hypothetical protein K4H25_01445 [Deefgea piscis]